MGCRSPRPRDVLQLKSSQAAGKHGVGLLQGLMGQAGQFFVLNIFALICTPVQTTCSQRMFCFPSLSFCAPLCKVSQGHHSLPDAGGSRRNTSLLCSLLSTMLICPAISRTALFMSHRDRAPPMFKSRRIIFPYPFWSPVQRWLL